jgi:hypothetical protein
MMLLVLLACGGSAPTPSASPAAPAASAPTAPPATFTCCGEPSLDALVATYVSGSEALAADRDGATDSSALVERAMAARAVAGLPAATADALVRLEGAARDAANAPDVKLRRAAWKQVSGIVVPLARSSGGGTRAYREAWCPMAEAAWLQAGSSTTVANPYYGAEMLTCGAFR